MSEVINIFPIFVMCYSELALFSKNISRKVFSYYSTFLSNLAMISNKIARLKIRVRLWVKTIQNCEQNKGQYYLSRIPVTLISKVECSDQTNVCRVLPTQLGTWTLSSRS